MYKIDLAMKGLSDQIEALSKRGTIAQINAEYSDVGYFTATSESISDYTNGMVISLSLNQTNQGTVGLNINEIGTVQIVYATSEGQLQDITAGMMKQNSVYFCVYNGTYWVLSSAGYASTSNNVSDTINGKNITDIFETDGTTAKNATLQKQTEKLQTPVSIGLSGVTATVQQFDGSQGITIPITEVPGQIVEGAVDLAEDINKEWSEVDEITPAEPEAPRVADQLNGYTSQQIIDQTKEDLKPNIINTYTCVTSETTHALTGTGNNIKFVADAAFAAGDTITVNGTAVTAQTQDGAALAAGAWASGATVVCWLDGTTLTVCGGSNAYTPPSYSTDPVDTGKKWIDGKTVWQKVINYTTPSNSGTALIDIGDTVDTFVSVSGFVSSTTAGYYLLTSFTNSDAQVFGIANVYNNNGTTSKNKLVVVNMLPKFQGKPAYAIVEYTRA